MPNNAPPSRILGGRSASDYTIVVAYDGEKTEDEYFRSWKLIIPPSRLSIIPIFVRSGGSPLVAVKKADREKKKLKDFAEFWCVTDRDDADDECVRLAWDLADKNDIRLCLSTRCFEIWFALHFGRYARSMLNERDAVDAVRDHIPQYSTANKTAPFATLLPLTDAAINNAEWLARQNCQNPSTNISALVRKLRDNLR
jgi:hypothetical protein